MALLLAVFYFVSVILDQTQKLTIMAGHVLKCAKRVFGIPDFKYYASGMALVISSPVFQDNYKNNRKYPKLNSVLDLDKFWGMSNSR